MATKAKKKYTYLTKAIQLPDGTRKYIRGKDQKELEEKVLKAQIMVNAGVDICSEETFGHFAQMWYDIYKKPYLRENSQNAIKYVMNQHILPYIGGYRLRDISPMQIQSIMAALSDKSNSLQSKVLIALRSIFKAAQENGLVAKSPVSSMLKPSGKKTSEKVALTPQESDLLLQRVKNDRAYTFLLIALQTGMRRGEIVGLQWSDIDFESRMIRVRHNAVLGRYETTVSELMKTKAGRRDIPLRNEINNIFRENFLDFTHLEIPHYGEKIVCKRNNWGKFINYKGEIYLTNGLTGFVDYVEKSSYNAKSITVDFRPDFSTKAYHNLKISLDRLNNPTAKNDMWVPPDIDLFEYAYALTGFACQGSQWDNVCILEEDDFFHNEKNYNRLKYSEITRAVNSVTYVLNE